MPVVKIEVTREGVTKEQKQALIKGVTDLISDVLNKNPQLTHVLIKEYDLDDWGFAGEQVSELRAKGITADKK
ncbi:tautomerase family protein [Pedobacter rhizosphaerae]|uniref:Tautomerase n=1 Tax=Pedobacter rhizosphaerae TaxID=390241 RepID=A0A1H9U6U7_9SPHI|nr:4-oxalocrotonate tautomerase family protein [Pedobacter rhizosphaerae]SES04991.1 4-oxalocrotonate tautomerase [Pedobacter rhizosphaerae]